MKRFALRAAAVAALWAVVASSAFAASVNIVGSLSPGGPTEPEVAIISTPNCTGGTVVFAALYRAFPFHVDTTGSYTITEPGTSSAVYVYSGSFNPTLPASNCLAASNTNPINFNANLTAGAPYVLVVIDDTFTQAGLSFSLTISGPGNITVPGVTPQQIPAVSPQALALLALILAAAGAFLSRRGRSRRT